MTAGGPKTHHQRRAAAPAASPQSRVQRAELQPATPWYQALVSKVAVADADRDGDEPSIGASTQPPIAKDGERLRVRAGSRWPADVAGRRSDGRTVERCSQTVAIRIRNGDRSTPSPRVRAMSFGDVRGSTQGVDACTRASSTIRRRLAWIRCESASNLRNRGTTLMQSHRHRSSKRVILGHDLPHRPCRTTRRSDER
jgi:hypothetical protein